MKPRLKSSKPRNVELGKIHMAAAKLGLITQGDDSAYRDMLWSVARVRSAKDLDIGGRKRVLDHLRSVGWQDARPFVPRQRSATPQVEKVRFLWSQLDRAGALRDGTDRGLRAYVRRMTASIHPQGIGYSAPELMTAGAAQHVIECLKRWCVRLGVATE